MNGSAKLEISSKISSSVLFGDVSHIKNRCALLYIFFASIPTIYLAPVLLVLCLLLSICELFSGREPTRYHIASFNAKLVYIYFTISAVMSGVSIFSLLSYDSIRYDANLFYSFMPILIIGTGLITIGEIDLWVKLSSVFGSLAFIIGRIVGMETFESHNAAGGYFMVLLAFIVARAEVYGYKKYAIYILFLVYALYLSDSRGSIVSLLSVVIVLKLYRKYPRSTLIIGLIIGLSVFVGLLLAYNWWQSNGSLYIYDYTNFGPETKGLSLDQFLIGERPGTVLHRILFLYPMAIDLFLKSPIVGVGFTRFDDFPMDIVGLRGVVALNMTNYINHSDLHAHNSYLHIAAETGMVGIYLIFRFLRSLFTSFKNDFESLLIVQMTVGSLLVASLFEHRLTTPSQATPVFLLVGLLWVRSQGELKS